MNKPQITEEKLETLLRCLVREFKSAHANNLHQLKNKAFYLADRMGCCKKSGLNYEFKASTREGDIVNVMSSAFVSAITELAHRGYVTFTESNLAFLLAEVGYEFGNKEPAKIPGWWTSVKNWANGNQGVIALLALAISLVGAYIAYASMPNA